MKSSITRSPRCRNRIIPRVERLEDRTVPTSAVTTFGSNAQHTGDFQPAAQDLSTVRWQTPVDLAPPYNGGDLLIHYGVPLITSANTVLVPEKATSSGNFQIDAFDGSTTSGVNPTPLYTLSTDYHLPSSNWVPSYGPALETTSTGTRLYYAGAGGTVYYINNPDSSSPGAPVQQVFYTSLANYQANAAAYNSTIFIDTPITADSNGDIFFGFRVQGTAPAPLSTTQSGYARIDPSGNATYVLAGAAAGDSNIAWDSHNAAPALSNDGSTLYVLVKSATSWSNYGYLLGLDSTTLATKYKVFLQDPRNGNGAGILDDGTASPMVAPDGTVFVGVMGNPYNGSRGFLLHFSADLTQTFLPGAFGWDNTASIVPAGMVPSYTGSSPYLVFAKYNNYSSVETGSSGGNGINEIAILDPFAAETDERNDGSPPLQVMREVLTANGPVPDPGNISTATPEAVREWCINTAAVDPATDSIFTPSEDGHLYRWDLASNSLDEALSLGAGLGEAYVPTVIGPDGTVYPIFNATLYAIGNVAGDTVGLTSSAPSQQSVVAGQSITFTASVTNTGGSGLTPTGSITFEDGSTSLATVTLDSTGHASYTTASLPNNPTYPWAAHFISAVYSGDSNFSAGTATLVQVVHASATTTTVSATPNPVNFGQSVTLTATVTPAVSGLPGLTGTVTFLDGSTVLGQLPVGSGTATLTTTELGVGGHTITAVYNGDPEYAMSSGTCTANPLVVQDGTSTSVTSSPNPSVDGQSVTVTATVVANDAGAGVPSGKVTFTEGATTLASGVPVNATGTASFTTSNLAVGSNTITATFSGSAGWLTSSGDDSAAPQVVNADGTTTAVTAAPATSVYGLAVTFTATVSANAPGSGTPTGTVTFTDGSTTLGTATLSGGSASLTTSSPLTLGNQTITASYGGDGNFNASSGSAGETVLAATTTAVTASPATPVYGQTVTLGVVVSPVAPGTATPTGKVTFQQGGTVLGTATLSGGKAVLNTKALTVGNDTVTANYSGDSNDAASSGTANVTVSLDGTTTTVNSSANPSVYGQRVIFTARVTAQTPGSGTPTGTVTFYDGSTALGTGTLSSGVVKFSAPLSLGGHAITASYGGDSNFTASSSGALSQTVNPDGSVTTLWSSANPSVYGQSVTFTVRVVAQSPGAGTPTGTVTFTDGSTTLGTATLSSGGATLKTASLNLGGNAITATYNGDTNFTTSTSGTLTQTVNQAGTTTTLTSSANPSVYGQSVTFTAKVAARSPGSGTPTGTVTFQEGSTVLGTGTLSGGKATFTTAVLSVGADSITAVYGGDTDFTGSTSSALKQTVKQSSTVTTVSSSVNPSAAGQAVTFTAVVAARSPGAGTPTGTVTFKDGTTVLGTGTLDSSGQATCTTSGLTPGKHSITAVYGGDSNFLASTSTTLTQTVQASANVPKAPGRMLDRGSAVPAAGANGQGLTPPAGSFVTAATGPAPVAAAPSGSPAENAGRSVFVSRAVDKAAEGWGSAGTRRNPAPGMHSPRPTEEETGEGEGSTG
jgi:hypothetical protein